MSYYYPIETKQLNNSGNIMNSSETIKECRKLAKQQSLKFKHSKTVSKINGSACYEIHSGVEHKVLHQGSLVTIWDTLLSGNLANQ